MARLSFENRLLLQIRHKKHTKLRFLFITLTGLRNLWLKMENTKQLGFKLDKKLSFKIALKYKFTKVKSQIGFLKKLNELLHHSLVTFASLLYQLSNTILT